jgi:hypothetical protein
MNIYSIKRKDDIDYDECAGYIIVANNENKVLEFAKKKCGCEGVEI